MKSILNKIYFLTFLLGAPGFAVSAPPSTPSNDSEEVDQFIEGVLATMREFYAQVVVDGEWDPLVPATGTTEESAYVYAAEKISLPPLKPNGLRFSPGTYQGQAPWGDTLVFRVRKNLSPNRVPPNPPPKFEIEIVDVQAGTKKFLALLIIRNTLSQADLFPFFTYPPTANQSLTGFQSLTSGAPNTCAPPDFPCDEKCPGQKLPDGTQLPDYPPCGHDVENQKKCLAEKCDDYKKERKRAFCFEWTDEERKACLDAAKMALQGEKIVNIQGTLLTVVGFALPGPMTLKAIKGGVSGYFPGSGLIDLALNADQIAADYCKAREAKDKDEQINDAIEKLNKEKKRCCSGGMCTPLPLELRGGKQKELDKIQESGQN